MLNIVKKSLKNFLALNFSFFKIKNKNKLFGLSGKNFDLFIDVGANVGDFPLKLNKLFKITFSNVVYIEPDGECQKELNKIKTKKIFPNCFIEKVSLGGEKKVIDFYKTTRSEENSSLQPLKSDYKKINVNQVTGEDIVFNYKHLFGKKNVLKIDTQGNEKEVLEGFKNYLNYFSIIIIEISFTKFYKNQSSFFEIMNILDEKFNFIGDLSQIYDENGKLSYMNACFEKKSYED